MREMNFKGKLLYLVCIVYRIEKFSETFFFVMLYAIENAMSFMGQTDFSK